MADVTSWKGFALIVAVLLAGAAHAQHTAHKHTGPPPVHAGIAGFDVYADAGVVHLLTADFGDGRAARALLYRRSGDEGRTWSAPVRVNTGGEPVYDLVRGNDPQLAARGAHVLAVWTVKGTGYAGSGPLVTAVSNDSGATWRPAGNPADDGSTAGHAYTELIAGPGGFDLVWLDGRDGAQGLRHARLGADAAKWSSNATVQKATCECCWNTLTRRGDALYVMYRGKGPRDMLLAEQARPGSAWQRISRVGDFGWEFQGCSHTGAGAAWTGGAKDLLHAVVWTGAHAAQGLHYLRSADRGRTWGPSHRVGSADARRADLAAHENGRVAIAWDQLEGNRRSVYVAQSTDSGARWYKATRISDPQADAMYPRAVATRGGFLVLWTESTAGATPVLRQAVVAPPRRD